MEGLLIAVLRRAELDLKSRNKKLREDAARWVSDPAGSMIWVAEVLGFDPLEVRRRLLAGHLLAGLDRG